MELSYDLVVIGAGPGGYVAAIRAAQLGMKVACVEKRQALGGTCLNVGCIPSKALLDSSEVYHLALEGMENHGVLCRDVRLDLKGMMARKDRVVTELTDGLRFLFKKNRIESITGRATLAGPTTVAVNQQGTGETKLEAKHILLATGSEPIELPFMPFDGRFVLSSTEALALESVPEHLVVVGGGYIGLELGSVWRRLGSKVTVVEFLPKIVPMMDSEIGQHLFRSLKKQGLEFLLETKVTGAEAKKGKGTLKAVGKGEAPVTLECDRVLVAVGRRACVDGLGLETLGVVHDSKTGKVAVDKHNAYRTNLPTISAIGDLIDGPMLAHKAEDEGIAFAEQLAGLPGHVNYDAIPSVVYTHPEVASVGATEEQLKERGVSYKVGKYPFQPNGRAKAMAETEGIVKLLAEARSDRLLGAHIIGPRASELIAEVVAVMEFGGAAEDIARTCHGHPTLSEVIKEAALAVDKRAIHG